MFVIIIILCFLLLLINHGVLRSVLNIKEEEKTIHSLIRLVKLLFEKCDKYIFMFITFMRIALFCNYLYKISYITFIQLIII